MSTLQKRLDETLKQLADFEQLMAELKVMPVETQLDRTNKNLTIKKLHVNILKYMLDKCKHSREVLKSVPKNVESLRELIF